VDRPLRSGISESVIDGFMRARPGSSENWFLLDSFTGAVWQHCDGSRELPALVVALAEAMQRPVATEEVFRALDYLADAGLLLSRASPPIGEVDVGRRALLSRVTPTIAAVATLGLYSPMVGADESSNKEYDRKEDSRKSDNRESNRKESNRKDDKRESDQKFNKREDDRREDNRKHSEEVHDKSAEDDRKESTRKDDEHHEQDTKNTRRKVTPSPSPTQTERPANTDSPSSAVNAKRPASKDMRPNRDYWVRAVYARVFDVVDRSIAECPEIASVWHQAVLGALQGSTLTAQNYRQVYASVGDNFGRFLLADGPSRARFKNSGFEFQSGSIVPVLSFVPDTSKQVTALTLRLTVDPGIGDNWRYILSAKYQRIEFENAEAAMNVMYDTFTPRQ